MQGMASREHRQAGIASGPYAGDVTEATYQRLLELAKTIVESGHGVIVDASHQCMTTRGIHKTGVSMVTSKMLGNFREDARTREEFLQCVGMNSKR